MARFAGYSQSLEAPPKSGSAEHNHRSKSRMSVWELGRKKASFGCFVSMRGRTGRLRHRGSPLGSKLGLEVRVCRPPGVSASRKQDSKWKFRFEKPLIEGDQLR